MIYRYVQYNGHGLTIWVNFGINVYVGGEGGWGFGSNGFVTKAQQFPIDGHYRTDIISGVGHLRSDSVVPLVLCTVAVQWLGYQHCTTSPSGRR